MTIQQRLVAAIEARGYVRQFNPRSSRFIELVPGGAECRCLIMPRDGIIPEHRVLVGKSGALRYTTGSIGNSFAFSDRMKQRLIGEHVACQAKQRLNAENAV